MIRVPRPDRYEREARLDRVEKRLAAACLCFVMSHLEDVGMEQRRLVLEEPPLFRLLGITYDQDANVADAHERDDARQVRIGEGRRPYRVRREKRDRHTVDLDVVARMRANPADAQVSARGGERLAIR